MTGRDFTLTTAETERNTTGTEVRHGKVTATAFATDEITEITIAHIGTVILLLNAATGTGTTTGARTELAGPPGSLIVTDALTITAITITGLI